MNGSNKERLRAKALEASLPAYKLGLQRAFAGTASPRAAIKANCLQCAGQVRDEITNCQVVTCALFEYRPYQAKAGEPEGEQE